MDWKQDAAKNLKDIERFINKTQPVIPNNDTDMATEGAFQAEENPVHAELLNLPPLIEQIHKIYNDKIVDAFHSQDLNEAKKLRELLEKVVEMGKRG